MPTPRARFITYRGTPLYLIDAEGLTPDEVIALADVVERDVRAQPPSSVLTITHVKGVPLDHRMTERLRRLTEGNKPHVKASAVTGLSATQRFVFNTVKILSRRDFHLFETVDEAKEFLVNLP
jgi:hypothetical protein